MGVVFLFLPAALLLVVAIGLLVWAGRGLAASRAGGSSTASVLRLVAGIGALAGAVLCVLSPFTEIPYAIVALPFLAFIATGAWLLVWLVAAAIVDARSRRA